MVIEVRFFANFREALGEKRIKISTETIDELLKKIVSRYPELEDEIFVEREGEKLRESLNISIDGRKINDVNNSSLELEDGDIVQIFPPFSGG